MSSATSDGTNPRYEGKIVVHHDGYGFVDFTGPGAPVSSAFIAPPDLNPLVSGDRVTVALEPSGKDRFQARDIALVERFRRELFGRVVRRRKRVFLEVDRHVANTDWPLDGADDVATGAWVIGRMAADAPRVTLAREVPEPEVSLARIIARYGLRTEYPKVRSPRKLNRKDRRDLRDIATVTIDGPTSRDLDDALSALPPDADGAIRVLVSIADVDALVPEGSPLDLEARARGTTVYLAGHTMPMLPPRYSEDALSLLPGVDRPALTAELRIDPEGTVRAVDLYASVICANRRLDYESVSRWLESADDEALPPDVRSCLRGLRAVSARLEMARATRGGVRLLNEETAIALDHETQEPTDVAMRTQGPANLLVERLMVAANEAVARWMRERGLPALYRVHEPPSPDRVATLATAARELGFEVGTGPELTPLGLAALERQFTGTPYEPVFQQLLRRLLGPARYATEPTGHFGLAAPLYLHFTSPIRRYADLVVHRVIKGYLRGERGRPVSEPAMSELADAVNQRALRARKAETDRERVLAARWFAARIGETWEGRVIAVKPFGLVLQLDGTGVAGTVPLEALAEGAVRVNATRDALVGIDDPEIRYGLGHRLTVEIADVDELLGRIDLRPPAPPKRGRRR
ncbi:MAG: VacB/RNase II family 3'-5' exoribonuclease, partial [Myxococcota bacterium]